MKYYVKADRNNCINVAGHLFQKCDKQTSYWVRQEFPSMTCAIWQCIRCEKVIESM